MPDYGSQVADKAIEQTARKVNAVYKQAAKELQAKFKDFNKKHKAKEKELRKKVKDGLMTQEQFDSWMTGQVFVGNQWQEKVDQAIRIMNDANNQAVGIVEKGKVNVFAENYNYSAYQLERRAKGVVSFNLYNEESVARLIKDKPEMLPKWKIDKKKDYIWNRRKVENSITQGIIQGEGIDQITNRLIDNLCSQNDSKMKTFARTAITGAQNAGRQKQAEDAEEMGITVKKKWVATLDDRTRDTHQELDGQEVDVDQPFTVEVDGRMEEIDYPGDPSAEPCLVYNCRCSMIQVYPGIDRGGKRRAYYDEDEQAERDKERGDGKHRRESYEVDSNLTYKQWKAQKEGTQEPKQEEAKPVEKKGVEKVKETISQHQGDWSFDELHQVGHDFASTIEDDTREAREKYEIAHREYEEAQKAYDDMKAQVAALDDAGRHAEADRLLVEKSDDLRRARREAWNKEYEADKERKKASTEAVRKRLSELREVGGVTKDNVAEFADLKYYNYRAKETKEKTIQAMGFYPKQWLEASKAGAKTLKPHWTSGRAYYSPSDGEIRFSSALSTNIHELGHRFESVLPAIKKAEKEFYEKRTAGEQLVWLGQGYRRDEKTRFDHFASPYMGKDYGDTAYELVSMGFQYVFTNYDWFLEKDPEMLRWCLGLLAGI